MPQKSQQKYSINLDSKNPIKYRILPPVKSPPEQFPSLIPTPSLPPTLISPKKPPLTSNLNLKPSSPIQEQEKEDSAIKTITEIEEITETTRRRRNVQEIQFDTQFHDKANLQDLYDAGLVNDDKIDALEGGAITAEELANELKPFLFSGEETIGGIYIEKTCETLSIYSAFTNLFSAKIGGNEPILQLKILFSGQL